MNNICKLSLKILTETHPMEAMAFVLKQLEDMNVINEGEKLTFHFPKALCEAAAKKINILNLENLGKILNIEITGEPEQILYSYKIKTESDEFEIPITAIECMYQWRVFNKKYNI